MLAKVVEFCRSYRLLIIDQFDTNAKVYIWTVLFVMRPPRFIVS